MIRTYGLTHISMTVRDVERSYQFYRVVFGVEEEIMSRGEWEGGEPYAFVNDPDGYEVEIWFE